MKGPMLPYEIRALRLWRCSQCGRTVRAAGSVVSRRCGCSGTDRAMTLIDRVPKPVFDASPFVTYDSEEFQDEPEADEPDTEEFPVEAPAAALIASDEVEVGLDDDLPSAFEASQAAADSALSMCSDAESASASPHSAPPECGAGVDAASTTDGFVQALDISASPNVGWPTDVADDVPPVAADANPPTENAAATEGRKGKRRRGRRRGKRRGAASGDSTE